MTNVRAEPYLRLAHDVGKYVARIAHNIGEEPVPAALGKMMVRDLYELPGGASASQVLATRALSLGEEPEIETARAHLAKIDALETRVRAGDDAALKEAATHALAVERELRALAWRIAEAEE